MKWKKLLELQAKRLWKTVYVYTIYIYVCCTMYTFIFYFKKIVQLLKWIKTGLLAYCRIFNAMMTFSNQIRSACAWLHIFRLRSLNFLALKVSRFNPLYRTAILIIIIIKFQEKKIVCCNCCCSFCDTVNSCSRVDGVPCVEYFKKNDNSDYQKKRDETISSRDIR